MPFNLCKCGKLYELSTTCPCSVARARMRERVRVRPSPAERGYNSEYRRNRRIILADDPLCAICGRSPATTADHIRPVSHGIDNSLTNLRPACKPCNSSRGSRG
ncbi:HNH endonuclease [Streptomyces sp. NPDC058424]|uniref:HNH endonuclease n=1 Tax=Streptomyces sp. NPDC058424 TaxID=3346491 RepID=UPI00365A53FD